MPSSGERGHVPVDLGLGADVDAARRLVEDQHARVHGQPLAEHDLLLVAAREVHHAADASPGVLMRRRATSASATRRSGCAVQQAPARVVAARSGSDVFSATVMRQHEAVALAVLGSEEHAAVDGVARAVAARTARRSSVIAPPSAGVTPKIVCISSVRPAPTRPAKPRISPRRAEKRDRRGRAGHRRGPSTASTRLVDAAWPCGPGSSGALSSRPTIIATIRSCVASRRARSPT